MSEEISEELKKEDFDYRPVHEDLNLGVNTTNVSVSTIKFDYVTKIIINLLFTDAAVEWTEFLAGSALTNGLFISVDGVAITPVIKTKGQLMEIGKKSVGAKDNDSAYPIQIILDFMSWCGNMGLQTKTRTGDMDITFDIKDDLSSLTGLFTAQVQGWKAR